MPFQIFGICLRKQIRRLLTGIQNDRLKINLTLPLSSIKALCALCAPLREECRLDGKFSRDGRPNLLKLASQQDSQDFAWHTKNLLSDGLSVKKRESMSKKLTARHTGLLSISSNASLVPAFEKPGRVHHRKGFRLNSKTKDFLPRWCPRKRLQHEKQTKAQDSSHRLPFGILH